MDPSSHGHGPDPARAMPTPLVSTAWLAASLGEPDLRIYDATLYLPTEGVDAARRYREAHIPGARFFDIDQIADRSRDLPHMAPSATEFEHLALSLDLCSDARVVFYDQRGLFSAARGWWLLRLFGHERVAVLDGGLPKWRREGRPMDSGTGPAPSTSAAGFSARLRPELLRTLDDVRANIGSAAERLLDARPAARFRAEVAEPRPGMRGGHVPGSTSLPHTELLDADGTLQPPATLRQRFGALGVELDTPVIASCGSGVTGTVILLALAAAGHRDGSLYDGSWAEWGGRADTPVATR